MHFSRFIPRSSAADLPPYGAHEVSANHVRIAAPPGAITPYLGLRSRLSQIWINKWTILLLLVLIRLLIAVGSLNDNMASAKREALSACTGVESMGSAMASMPHYMSKGVNELTASGVEKAVHGLMAMLMLAVTGVEEMVLFFIHVLTSTYLCLITLAVSGSLHAALKVIEEAGDFINKTAKEIGSTISKGVDGFEKEINKFVEGINTITSAFGGDKEIPKLDIGDSLDKLKDLHLPSSMDQGLEKLKDNIPKFDDVQDFTDNILRTPFEAVKKLINESISDFKFDRSVFPVPPKEQLSFCSDDDGINSFFNGLSSNISKAQKIFIGILIVGAILACVPMAWREIRRWRLMKDRSVLVQKDAHDPMDVVYIVSRPYTSTSGLKIANWFQDGRRQVLVRWVVAYATSTPALFVLSLGIAGLLSCACQVILLYIVKKEVPGLTGHVSQFADKVVHSLNNASEQWAIGTNGAIDSINADINEKVFGWVNETTIPVNNTLTAFVDKTSKALNDTFGGTILYEPIKEVLNCLIMLKVEGIQKALTWATEHAHVDFPNVRQDVFSLGAVQSISSDNSTNPDSFLANPGDKTADKITSVVTRVTESLLEGIKVEAFISTGLIILWLVVLLMAIIRALSLAFRRDKMRGEGGIDAIYHPPAISQMQPSVEMRGFQDVSLASPNNFSPNTPKFSAAPNVRGLFPSSDGYQEQKLGFAGQRGYEVNPKQDMRASSYAEMEYGVDLKRG
ncbi:plasma membrane fusion protein prm1 [Myotisia sp. PD_48]|nr:plasma membrane fusion protein prm1 [Myotisia sp. PD_48]